MLIFGLNSANVLAQVNLGTTPATFLGIFLAVAGAGLYFLRTVKPELSRDHDIFFAAIGLLCGFILIFQGWRLDPILQFGQLLLVGSTIFFAYESIRLRGIATEQAKRNTPIVDDERPISRDYKYSNRSRSGRAERVDAELAPLPYYEDEDEDDRPRPRITGSREGRSQRDDYYEDDAPRRSSRRSSNERPETSSDKSPRRRNSSRPTSRTGENIDDGDWGSPSPSRQVDDWNSSTEERKPTRSRNSNPSSRPEIRDDEEVTQPKARRRRPSSETPSRREREDDEVIPADYVDYKPIDRLDNRPESSTNYDDDTPIT